MPLKGMTSLKRQPLGREVTQVLRRMIIRGELLPGERLVEEQLAGRIGLSRTPVREALHRLEQDGLLSKRARGGYLVRPLTVPEVEEAEGVRSVLEGYAAHLAAQKAGDKDLALLAQNLEAFEQALAQGQVERLLALNKEFHHLLHQAAGSRLLAGLLADLDNVVERISRALISNLDAGTWSRGEHRAIHQALVDHDAKRAERLAREHVVRGGRYIVSRMQEENLEL